MRCIAIVVTFNGKKWYDKCFGTLEESSFKLEIIAVDNASTDDTLDYLSKAFPKIKIIENKTNLGFAEANNIGIKKAIEDGADYFFLLNQDAWIEKDTVEKLVEFSKNNPEYGIISPIHLTGDREYFDNGFRYYFQYCSETTSAYENMYLKKQEPACYESNFVNAAAWLLTKSCIEIVGGFDTIMFRHYAEDGNYCQRVLYHKLKIAIVTSTTICHDRAHRIDKPYDITLGFADYYANILIGRREYIKHLLKIILKIMSIKYAKNGIKEIAFVIKNINKIIKSRKQNKIGVIIK